jgi:hypothetical protein
MAARPGPDQVVGLGALLYVLPEVGRSNEARAIADEVLAASRRSGHPASISYALHGYGRAFAETNPERARNVMRQALALARDEGLGFFAALFARDLASVEAACGDRDEASRLFDIAIETFYRAGNGGSLALTLGYLTMFLDDIDRPSVAATIYGASTRYAAINTLPKLPTTVEHLRLVLGETEFTRCVAAGADMEPADAVRYARQQIEMLSRQPNAPSEPAPR